MENDENQLAQKRAQEALARALNVPASDLEIELCDGAVVPGLIPFRGRQLSKKGRRGSYSVGVLGKDGIELDSDKAMAAVAHALRSPDGKRQPDPKMLARVCGFLEGEMEPARAILSDKDLETIDPQQRPFIYFPRALLVDGDPAIDYWVRGHGVHRSRLVMKADGKVELEVMSIGSIMDSNK